VDDSTIQPRWGKVGKQRIEDTGPLTRDRMPGADDELYGAATKFMDKAVSDKKPFFIWFCTTRMHVWTHLKKSSEGVTGIGLYPDRMVEHDAMVGQMLKRLDDLGIADNTIVVYGTDNGAETACWPDGGITPFQGEKGTTWEGGFRVPMLVRWPGVIKPGTIINDIFSQEDWMPTLLAAAGDRSQFFKDLSMPFYGYNRHGAKVSEEVGNSFWLQGMMAGFPACYFCIKAFSETDQTQDLKTIDVPTLILHGDDDQIVPIQDSALLSVKLIKSAKLKIYKGAPHGMPEK
jgi:hypothetical protein